MPVDPQAPRLIEVTLPLAAISEQSAREKSIRHGHISTLHIWWARRPLAAMRAAIFAALVPAPESAAERAELEALIKVIVDWDQVKGGNSAAIEQAREIIRRHYPDAPPKLLDPFMGGGSTGLEALRLGCETYAVELNPVAHLIELCTLVYPQKYGQPSEAAAPARSPGSAAAPDGRLPDDQLLGMAEVPRSPRNPLAEDVRTWGRWVLERARAEIGHLYANPAGGGTIVGYLWARTVTCPNPACGAQMPLVRSWWLAKTAKRRIAIRPRVDPAARRVNFEVVNLNAPGAKDTDFDPSSGTVSGGKATCLMCDQVVDTDYIREQGLLGSMTQKPMVVVHEQGKDGKGYRPIIDQDADLYGSATVAAMSPGSDLLVEVIPETELRRVSLPLYGIKSWADVFSARQLVALQTFSRLVREAYDAMIAHGLDAERARAITSYLAIAVDRLSDFSSTLCTWTSGGEFIGHTFVRHALGMVWDYAESNPFSNSSGNWADALEWIIRVIDHASHATDVSASISLGTATCLPYDDESFDAIVTDPPYYDSVLIPT
jgi:adenine-specific DNA methylase